MVAPPVSTSDTGFYRFRRFFNGNASIENQFVEQNFPPGQ